MFGRIWYHFHWFAFTFFTNLLAAAAISRCNFGQPVLTQTQVQKLR